MPTPSAPAPPVITLLTDFGTVDPFVGMMKGVIAGVNPRATVIDLTHEIAPQDVMSGAFVLAQSYRFFPKGTIHVAVVDPGVGTDRRPLAVAYKEHYFVGPDNGLLWLAAPGGRAVELDCSAYFSKSVSATFHGRDVFAPVAAHLSAGVPLASLGSRLGHRTRLKWPRPQKRAGGILGQVVAVDRFGNLITNLDSQSLQPFRHPVLRVTQSAVAPVRQTYEQGGDDELIAVMDGYGLLEVAIRNGSAQKKLALNRGAAVMLSEGPASATLDPQSGRRPR